MVPITLFDGNGEKSTIKENEKQTKNGKRVPASGAKMAYHCVSPKEESDIFRMIGQKKRAFPIVENVPTV
jgi:hypothetical protein